MKKYMLLSSAAIALMLGTTSCGDDFLSVEPASSMPYDGYYNSEARIKEAQAATYDPMKWFDYFAGWAPLSLVWDSMGDDLYVGGGSTTDQNQIHLISQFKADPRNGIDGLWTACYSGINRAIHLIDNAKACPALSDEQKAQYVASGRAMRDWYYLVLWKTWGNVAYYEENLVMPYVAPQLTYTEVYNKVTADLEAVLDSKILPMKQDAVNSGLITQAAAAMTYADFVMYQGDKTKYKKAYDYMLDIINSGKYKLMTNYNDLFDITKEWNEEIIFDVNYIAKGGKRAWDAAQAAGGTVYPEMIGIDGLSGKDGVKMEFNGGWGFGAVSKEVYDAFEAGDKRTDVAVLNMEKYAKEKAAVGDTITYGGRYQNTGIFLRKYLPRPGDTDGAVAASGLNHEENLHLYRYAETLLNAAELALEVSAGDAQQYFDEVRTRAGLASKPATIDNIIDERRVEFVGEGKRYFDLVRSGKAAATLKAKGGKTLEGGFAKFVKKQDSKNQVYYRWEGKTEYTKDAIPEREGWTENKRFLPIPQGEIEAAQGALVQNPY